MPKVNGAFKLTLLVLSAAIFFALCSKKESAPAPNTLSQAEINDGWVLLFDGKSFDGWMMTKENGWIIDGDAVSLIKGYLWTKKRYGDFILDCEFKVSPQCNSGIFFRTDDIENLVQTGIEMQVLDSYGKSEIGKRDCGAIYDCLTPSVNAVKQAGEWNRIVLMCKDNIIKVVLNDVPIINMDIDKWTEPNMNPDGSKNKFNTALKDFVREGFIGLQDHGLPVWYRNIKIKEL